LLGGAGWARMELRQAPVVDESTAPAIENWYSSVGRGGGGALVGLRPEAGQISWRVNSDGTKNCRPSGRSALWNFASGTAAVDARGNFRASRTYFSPDRALDGTQYEKEVAYRLRGRLTSTDRARGKFWRRDRYYIQNELQFECTRSGRWTTSPG